MREKVRVCLCFLWVWVFALLFHLFRFLSFASPKNVAAPGRCNGGKGGATALVLVAMFRAVPPRLARHSDRSFSPPSPVSPFISSYSDFSSDFLTPL